MDGVITIKFKDRKLQYDGAKFDNLRALQEQLEKDTELPINNQKLIVQGTIIKDASTFGLLKGRKAVLIGIKDSDVEKVLADHEANKNYRVKDDYAGNPRLNAKIQKPRKRGLAAYRFHEIKVLEQFDDKEVARGILEELAEDPGFVKVLEKHKWNVGTLSEMMPEGFVGVSAVCVLGVNKNKGQEISLRIRTDDLKGFRKMTSIREVLCHELAHMVHSEHDGKFFQLMREIQREIVELNWTLGTGRVLGSSPPRRRLGGPFDPRPVQAKATEAKPKVLETAEDKETEMNDTEEEETIPSDDKVEVQTDDVVMEESKVVEPVTHREEVKDDVKMEEVAADEKTGDTRQINVDLSSLPTVPENRKEELTKAIEMLCARNDEAVALSALEVMLKLVNNILKSPQEEKFRRVKMSNKVFHSKVLSALSGRHVMNSMGWVLDEDSNSMLAFDSPESLAMLFFALTEIERCTSVLQVLVNS